MTDVTPEDQETARLLGHAVWRQTYLNTNSDLPKDEVKTRLKEEWAMVRRDQTRFGAQLVRALRQQGYAVTKVAETPADEAADAE